MKYLRIIISFIAISTIFIACEEDFLQRDPLDQVTSANFFKTPGDLEIYMNQYYDDDFFPTKFEKYGNDFGTDNQIDNDNVDSRLEGTRTLGSANRIRFNDVRSINYFFDNYKKAEEEYELEDYQQYLGEAYFFRALIYFDLLKSYGDIQWITTELGTSSPELYSQRDPRNVVADNIILALDSAAMYLTDKKTSGAERINKWMALLVQSRVALYEGTWQKYHNNTDFGVSNAQPDKYFNKVVEATTEIMESEIYDIYSTGEPNSDYKDLFSLRSYSSNDEVLFWFKHDEGLFKGDITNNRNYRMQWPTDRSITKGLADSYLCTDGKPITDNTLFQGYSTLMDEKQNRDPRYCQTIACPDGVRLIYEDGSVQYWSAEYDKLNQGADDSSPAGYIIHKGYDPRIIYHETNFEETPTIIYRYAEVLLNFAEARAELGNITQTDIDKSIKKLRDRVDMPNLILTDIADDPEWNFPSLSPVINEIRRERRVELAAEGFRWNDIARWAAADELIVGKRPKGFLAAQLDTNPHPVDEKGFLDPFANAIPNGYGFKLDRDYLDAIPLTEITLNPDLEQNPGWGE